MSTLFDEQHVHAATVGLVNAAVFTFLDGLGPDIVRLGFAFVTALLSGYAYQIGKRAHDKIRSLRRGRSQHDDPPGS
jgi:hypothetical protein